MTRLSTLVFVIGLLQACLLPCGLAHAALDSRQARDISRVMTDTSHDRDASWIRHRTTAPDAKLQAVADDAARKLADIDAGRAAANVQPVLGHRNVTPEHHRIYLLLLVAKHESDYPRAIRAMQSAAEMWRTTEGPASGYAGNAYKRCATLMAAFGRPANVQYPYWKAWADIMSRCQPAEQFGCYYQVGEVATDAKMLTEAEQAYRRARASVTGVPAVRAEVRATLRLVERVLIPAGRIDEAMTLFRENESAGVSLGSDEWWQYHDLYYYVAKVTEDPVLTKVQKRRESYAASARAQSARAGASRGSGGYTPSYRDTRPPGYYQQRDFRDHTAGYLGSLGLVWKQPGDQ